MSESTQSPSFIDIFRTTLIAHYRKIAANRSLNIREQSLSVIQLEGLCISAIHVYAPDFGYEPGKKNPFLLFSVQASETKWVVPGDYMAVVDFTDESTPKSGIETLDGELGKGFGIQFAPSPYPPANKHQVEISGIMTINQGEKGNRYLWNGILGTPEKDYQFGIVIG